MIAIAGSLVVMVQTILRTVLKSRQKVFRGLLLQRAESPILSKADIYYRMGDIYMQQNDSRRALGMFQRGLEADKNHEDCQRMVDELKGSK